MTADQEGPVTLFTRHVVVPAAIIAMVTAFLFYLLELRSVFLEGGAGFKQVGLCFSVATVLIARYGRVSGTDDSQSGYTAALALATLLFMLTRSSGASFVPNVLIILAVWRFATSVTRALSLEGELDPRPKEHRLYGLERLRFEAFRRRQQLEKPLAWGTRRTPTQKPDAHGNPVAAVARLAALALLGFAIGEPFLLRAAPEVAERALADVIVFLFATGLVLAAGSAAGTLRHTLRQGGRVSPGVLPTRLALAALLAVAVLAAALAIPGVHFKGQGRLRSTNLPGKTGPGENQTDGRRSSNAKSDTPDAQPRGSRTAPRQQPDPDAEDDSGETAQAAETLVNALSSLGKLLRIPLLLGIPILVLLALLRLGPLLPSWSDLMARLRTWLSRFLPKRKPRPAPVIDPFADLGSLAALPPHEAILAAYARLLAALNQAGHPRPERTTPYEHLAALPARLKPLAAPARRVTDIYVVTAYGNGKPTPADREQAVGALVEIQGLLRERAA
ncbi:MAG TPA: DUF4129 domain-containing protein [Thermoanaerobaculia bacterium]|nr:DUF4129 domain-containing protein [Thermoanaerobaculia bacterium]